MQRALSLLRHIPKTTFLNTSFTFNGFYKCFSSLQNNFMKTKLLPTTTTFINPVCNFKVKGRLRRRCKYCYFVLRQERLYVICPKFPRHKQMAMTPKPHNTWILTHASQSPIRPW